jgi:hypothetical protein
VLLAALAVSSFATNQLARAEGEEVVKGAAASSADTFTLEITSGGAAIGLTLGRSTAEYRDITASAQGRALDLGLLADILGLPQCNGKYPPIINVETMPPKTAVDSFSENSAASRVTDVHYPGIDKAPAGAKVGTQDARALPQPWGQSSTTTVNTNALLLAVDGGATESTVEFVDDTRVARAVSTAYQLRIMGGLIVFHKPRWEAVATSGATESQTATFTFERATVLGIPRSSAAIMADLQNFKWTIQQLLSQLGVVFQLPEVKSTPGGGIEITPMGFLVENPPIGRNLVVPLLTHDLVTQMREQQIAADCRKNTDWTIIAALEGAFAGTGDIKLLAGGARASTDATDYAYHPEPESPTTVVEETSTTTAVPTTEPILEETTYDPGYTENSDDFSYDSSELTTDSMPMEDLALPAEEATEGATKEEAAELDEIAAPSRKRSEPDSSAAAIAVGVVALLGAVGLSMGDRLVGRRAKRRIA